MDNTTLVQTQFIFSDRHRIPVTNQSRCLFNCFTVAQHLSNALNRYVSVYEIETIQEWQYVLWVKIQGKSPRFVSKKKVQAECAKPSDYGSIVVNLSSRVVPNISPDGSSFVTYIGYGDEGLARKARSYILSRGLAITADVRLSEGITSEKWELKLMGMSLFTVMHLAQREVNQEIEQNAIAARQKQQQMGGDRIA